MFTFYVEHAGSTTLINSGSILIKNSVWSRSFLKLWWDYEDRRLYSDQEQFDLVYQQLKLTNIQINSNKTTVGGSMTKVAESTLKKFDSNNSDDGDMNDDVNNVIYRDSEANRASLNDIKKYQDSDTRATRLLSMIRKLAATLEGKIVILPPDVLNSDPPAMTQLKPHNQVLHLMVRNLFISYYIFICCVSYM